METTDECRVKTEARLLVRWPNVNTVSTESWSNKCKNYLSKIYSKNDNVLYTIWNISL